MSECACESKSVPLNRAHRSNVTTRCDCQQISFSFIFPTMPKMIGLGDTFYRNGQRILLHSRNKQHKNKIQNFNEQFSAKHCARVRVCAYFSLPFHHFDGQKI